MALKGYLASGFQKLIGASRLKGANDQWVGEPNRVQYVSNTIPVTASLVNGFNYLEWAPSTSNVTLTNTTALFSSTPTSMVEVTIRNTGTTLLIFNNAGSVTGSCVGLTQLILRPGEQATFIYDLGTSRWQEKSRGPAQVYISGVAFNPYSPSGYRHEISSLSPGSDLTIDTINTFVYQQDGDMITFLNNSSSNIVTFQQDPTGTKLIMNGDCALTKYSSITFIYYQFKWVELSRNMVGGY
jgi:hypothetical protein